MYRIFSNIRFSTSIVSRRYYAVTQSTTFPSQIKTENDDDLDDDHQILNRIKSPSDYIFADSKSAKFKERSKRKQKKWTKELEERQIVVKTPLATVVEKTEKTVRDAFITADGKVREDESFNYLDDLKDNVEQVEEPDEPKPLSIRGNRYPVWYYAGKLKQLASENKVHETLNFFYNEMMDKQRVAPNLFCYQVVIGICARNGYLTQAFDLYREMKDRGYSTVDSRKMSKIFTLLATACYRASDEKLATEKAKQFLDEIKEKEFRIEYRTFNALIAAFGKHHQTKMAFQLADEMVEVGFKPNEDTYASLLIACQGEKVSGFRYAIEVWRRMLAFNIRPTEYHFGLLLNITHECGLGSTESLNKLLAAPNDHELLQIEPTEKKEKFPRETSFLVDVIDQTNDDTTISPELVEVSNSTELTSEWWENPDDLIHGNRSNVKLRPFMNGNILKPNILYEEKNLVAIRAPRSPIERLMLLGGIPGVLQHMKEHNVQPNNIILNSLLKLIPLKVEYENALMQVAKTCGLTLNIQFYNILLRRRVSARARSEISEVLEMIRDNCLSPDEYTFSALARGCETREDAEQLFEEMKELNLKVNQKIFESMLKPALSRKSFRLLTLICESYKTFNLPVNETFIQRVENFLHEIREKILIMERANVDDENYRILSSSYDRFKKFYEKWLRSVSYVKRFDEKLKFRFDKPNLKEVK